MASKILLLLTSLGLYTLIGRKLGPEGLGQFSFVLALIGLFTFLPDLGINLFLTREVSRQPKLVHEYLGRAFTIVLILAPLTFGTIVLAGYLLSDDQKIRQAISIAGVFLVLGAFSALFRAAFYAYERMEYDALIVVAERVLILVGCALILFYGGNVVGLISVHVLARLVALLIGGWIFSKKISRLPRLSFDRRKSWEMLRSSTPFALNVVTTTIYVQIDLVLLTLWVGAAASGYYKAATALIIPLAVIATSLNTALFPNMSRAYVNSRSQAKDLIEHSMRYLFMIGWPIALGTALLAPQIIFYIYGEEFQPTVLVLQILAFIIPLRFINNSMGTGLTAVNRQKTRAGLIMFSAVLNLALNVFLIKRYSYIGAGISTLITELVISAGLYITVFSFLGKFASGRMFFRIFLAGLIMAVVTYLLRDYNLFIAIGMSAGMYGIALLVLKALPEDDLNKVKRISQGIRSLRA